MNKPVAALMYDFDKTLCTKDMQEYGFIPDLGMKAEDFWNEVNQLTDREEMDNILAYMFMMVDKCKEKNLHITKEYFHNLGKGIEYFNGVESWFERINKYGEEIGVDIEHYIVSSGIKEIIEGTSIAKYFKKIYACEFMYDKNDGSIKWPKFAVNYTAKTQFLFRINKGVLDVDSDSASKLNCYTPENERRIPFRNMIYLGDGLTDVPCMKLVKANGGQSIAVFGSQKGDTCAVNLLKADRVNHVTSADYSPNSDLENRVKAIIKKIQAVEEMESYCL